MRDIKIITESNSDITDELLKKYDIDMVSQYVTLDDVSYKDRKDMSGPELLDRVSRMSKLPKTAAPSPSDFHEVFRPQIDSGKDIICICTSPEISATYQNACIAAGEFPEGRIEVVNSMNISSGIGILVLEAVDCVKSGLDIHQTAEILRSKVSKIKTIFIIDTLEFLRKGGRCSALESFIGDILKIRPVLGVVDGKLALIEKTRGNRKKALGELLKKIEADKENIDTKRIMLSHAMGLKDAQYLKTELEKLMNFNEIVISETGCSVSTHCGPNTVGIIYLLK